MRISRRLRAMALGDYRAADAIAVVLETMHNPRATAGAELARKAGSAAERGLWPEALADYDRAIETDWDQPSAHYGRAIAVLAQAAEAKAVSGAVIDDAAESFAKVVRYGRTTAPAMAARAALAAVVLFDRAGAADRCDAVLREAAQGILGSPELQFVAGKRLRAPEFLARAVKLDPTLVVDPLWPEQPWAEPVNAAVLERQRAALGAGERALGVPVEKPLTCAAGFHALRDLVVALRRAERDLAGPAPGEFRLEQRRQAAQARFAAAQTADRQLAVPVPVVVLGVLALPAVCVGGVVSRILGGGFGPGAGTAALVLGCALMVLVPHGRRRRRAQGEQVAAAFTALQATWGAIDRSREQRAKALDSVRVAREQAEGLTHRASIALTLNA